LSYFFLIYDCLNDDDEEIREAAASTVNDCLDRRENGYLPINASNQLLAVIVDKELHCARATDEAIKRLTGGRLRKGVILPRPSLSVSGVLTAGAALFAVEKQNLYIDDFRESKAWAKVLRNFVPTARQFDILESWTLSGLRAANNTNIGLEDLGPPYGPLGWSSKPEFFLLIARILACAEVVLFWAREQRRETEVLDCLMRFATNGERSQINEFLLTMATTILERSIIRILQTSISRLYHIIPPTASQAGPPRNLPIHPESPGHSERH
jgi:hypothetical protein